MSICGHMDDDDDKHGWVNDFCGALFSYSIWIALANCENKCLTIPTYQQIYKWVNSQINCE